MQFKKSPIPNINKTSVDYGFLEKISNLLDISNIVLPLFETHHGVICFPKEVAFEQIDKLFSETRELIHLKAPLEYGKALLNIIEIILLCIKHSAIQSDYSVINNPTISRILEEINFDISYPNLSLDYLSKKLYISKYYICKIFKKYLNVTFMEYVISQRLALAKVQLIKTDQKCSEIAESCGFSSFSFFSRKFQEKEGITASQYRKKKREQQKTTE